MILKQIRQKYSARHLTPASQGEFAARQNWISRQLEVLCDVNHRDGYPRASFPRSTPNRYLTYWRSSCGNKVTFVC